MNKRKVIEVPVNRVEGDLEVRVEIQDNVITDAWSSGLMYRGGYYLKGTDARAN